MFVAIRSVRADAGGDEALVHASRTLASELSGMPGFVSFLLVEAEDGLLTSITIFEDRPGLLAADDATLRWMVGGKLLSGDQPGTLIAGEIVAQRGL